MTEFGHAILTDFFCALENHFTSLFGCSPTYVEINVINLLSFQTTALIFVPCIFVVLSTVVSLSLIKSYFSEGNGTFCNRFLRTVPNENIPLLFKYIIRGNEV